MLSTTQVVAVRKAIELTYDCTCNIIEHQKYKKNNKSTGFKDVVVQENQKCKLSFKTIASNKQDDIKANIVQIVKLFIAPELKIETGSRIDVTNVLGEVVSYKSSGQPAIYKTHQEIVLELFESWT